MPTQVSRRSFLHAAGSAAALVVAPRRLVAGSGETPPSETVHLAVVGIGGQGQRLVEEFSRHGQVVAFADVDPRMIERARVRLPQAKVFEDYRAMYDEVGKDIDAVIVATPDHWHALPALHAMQCGKHVYVEKPLARTIWEVRQLMVAARKFNVVTQMGNQGHSLESNRVFASWVQKGLLGRITEVHTWVTMRLISSKSKLAEIARQEEIPAGLNWHRWIGPARFHPYSKWFMPEIWRAWTPFGTGTPGDWGCHLLDPIFTALGLRAPKTIVAEVTPGWDAKADALAFPDASRVTFEFELPNRKMLKVLWHDGEFCNEVPRPPMLEEGRDLGNQLTREGWKAGAVVYGTENTLTYGSHGAASCRLIPEERMRDLIRTKTVSEFKNLAIGEHTRDFVAAIKTGRQAGSDFAFAGVVVEAALLGSIAIRNPGVKLEWDATNMTITNCKEANAMVTPEYRKGYELKV
ncbi:MAG: Gfo/Idh/MocA family protein [Acidobacteriota bacterium]